MAKVLVNEHGSKLCAHPAVGLLIGAVRLPPSARSQAVPQTLNFEGLRAGNLHLPAVVSTSSAALADRLVFDNSTGTTISEPASTAVIAGLLGGGAALPWRVAPGSERRTVHGGAGRP